MHTRYAARYAASVAPWASIPWICGSSDFVTAVVAPGGPGVLSRSRRAAFASIWSFEVGEAERFRDPSRASWLQVVMSPMVATSARAMPDARQSATPRRIATLHGGGSARELMRPAERAAGGPRVARGPSRPPRAGPSAGPRPRGQRLALCDQVFSNYSC